MFLVPNPYQYSLYEEFLRERRTFQVSNFFLYFLGWSCFFTYIVLVFFFHVREAKYFLLDVSGLLFRFSGIVLSKKYEIPNVFYFWLDTDRYLSRSAEKTIFQYRSEILKVFYENLFSDPRKEGWKEASIEEVSILNRRVQRNRYNWNRISKIYFVCLFLIQILIFFVLVHG